MVLDGSSELIVYLTAEKLKCPGWFSFIFSTFGPFSNFILISVTDSSLAGCSDIHLLLKPTQPAITCSKLTIETLEQGVKYVQS